MSSQQSVPVTRTREFSTDFVRNRDNVSCWIGHLSADTRSVSVKTTRKFAAKAMSSAAAKRCNKKSPPKDKRSEGLWIDPSRLPNARCHFFSPEKPEQNYLENRYLKLADLVLKESPNEPPVTKKKIA